MKQEYNNPKHIVTLYTTEPIKIILHQEMYDQIEKGLEDEKNYK